MNKEYFEKVKPTYIENWPKEFCSLSIAQFCFKLSLEEMMAIMEKAYELKDSPLLKGIEDRISEEVKKFPKGAFIRLGSRSPKDVEIKPIFSGKEGMELLILL